MAEMSQFLYQLGELSGETIFIDGTKIEACANKYTFVWKKAVSKNLGKLLEKLAVFVELCEETYEIKVVYQNQVKMKHICGTRNSYSKTDHDATFMRMKEDAMGNGQLKAGYNLQHGVDSEYISWLTLGLQPADTTTLIPFLKSMERNLGFSYSKVVTDSGYESEENYRYLDGSGMLSYIKPANYEISKTRKYKKDIGRVENMEYDEATDIYTCHNGKKLHKESIKKEKTRLDMNGRQQFIPARNAVDVHIRRNASRGTTVRERSRKHNSG